MLPAGVLLPVVFVQHRFSKWYDPRGPVCPVEQGSYRCGIVRSTGSIPHVAIVRTPLRVVSKCRARRLSREFRLLRLL